jgi:hypothetical protein
VPDLLDPDAFAKKLAIAQPTEGRSVEPTSPRASSLLSPGRGGAHAGARTRSQPAGLRNMATVLEHHAFLDLAKQYDWAGIEQAITANPAIVNVNPSGARWRRRRGVPCRR